MSKKKQAAAKPAAEAPVEKVDDDATTPGANDTGAAAANGGDESKQAEASDAPKKTVAAALGEMAWLLAQSPNHRHALFCADLEWLVMPPLMQGQYRLFYAQERPVGVALWAFVSETVEQRLAGGGRIGSEDWRSGDRVWLVEIVAPFGNQDRMLEDLRKTALADRKFRFIRTHPNGQRETVEQNGENVP